MTDYKNNRIRGLNDRGFLLYYKHNEEVKHEKRKDYTLHCHPSSW